MPKRKPEPWNRFGRKSRKFGIRERRRVLLLCEDSKSALLYFKGFRIDPRRVEIVAEGTGWNTDSLVEKAIERKRSAIGSGRPFNEIWCVFDRDSFPLQDYNRAFQLAENAGIQIAWSNEAFEIWYLLHFDFHSSGISRHVYGKRLRKCLGCDYDKADDHIYSKLLTHQPAALKNAKRLENQWFEAGKSPRHQNPSTSVHKLVQFLNELAELGPAEE